MQLIIIHYLHLHYINFLVPYQCITDLRLVFHMGTVQYYTDINNIVIISTLY